MNFGMVLLGLGYLKRSEGAKDFTRDIRKRHIGCSRSKVKLGRRRHEGFGPGDWTAEMGMCFEGGSHSFWGLPRWDLGKTWSGQHPTQR